MVLERYLVDYSAAVLADQKVGNLFLFPASENFQAEFNHCARRLCPFGVAITHFKVRTGQLIYVYRPDRLKEVLERPECRRCLKSRGYRLSSLEALLEEFRGRIETTDFPHEIGFLLGYPIPDVLTFLSDVGKNPKMTGYWQVYHDVEDAKQTFHKLTQCYNEYKHLYRLGTPLEDLIKGVPNEKNCGNLLERDRQHRVDGSINCRRRSNGAS